MIDPALMRPGRLEVHIEVGLPDEKGREQIFRIHTKKMRENGLWAAGADDIGNLAARTKNYTGAEIKGLVKSATSFAQQTAVDMDNLDAGITKEALAAIKITMKEFDMALDEVRPAFGVKDEELQTFMPEGIIEYSTGIRRILQMGDRMIRKLQDADSKTRVCSMLLRGPKGAGKTALAAKLATDGNFPFVKVVSPGDFVGWGENPKLTKIDQIFDDAFKTPFACIIIDEIEMLLNYVPMGPRFSSVVLQGIRSLIKSKRPPPESNSKLFIIGTTDLDLTVTEDLLLDTAFEQTEDVPLVSEPDEFREVLDSLRRGDPPIEISDDDYEEILKQLTSACGIKKLLRVCELAKFNNVITYEEFKQAAEDFNIW